MECLVRKVLKESSERGVLCSAVIVVSEEISLTDQEESEDDSEPTTTPYTMISSKTISKFYGHFRDAIGFHWLTRIAISFII